HISGFFVGIVLAFVMRQNLVQNKKYAWEEEDYNPEEDEFLQHFDDDGNFIESVPEPPGEAAESETKTPTIRINYIIRKKRTNED
ncbi:MAG: rhomboid family intramembrane serine protease, partial [Bacteroidota bacterium]